MTRAAKNAIICGAIAILALWALSAVAAPKCGFRAIIAGQLKLSYGEIPAATGMRGSQLVYELFLSPKGSWTILVNRTDGISCILASGREWEQHQVPGRDS